MVDPMLMQYPGLERKVTKTAIQLGAGAPVQIAMIAWTPPANAVGFLEKLVISNQNASAGVVTVWDADITSVGTVPPARGSNAAPLLPPVNIAAGAQVFLGYDLCLNLELQGGIVAQSTVATMYIAAQWVEQIG